MTTRGGEALALALALAMAMAGFVGCGPAAPPPQPAAGPPGDGTAPPPPAGSDDGWPRGNANESDPPPRQPSRPAAAPPPTDAARVPADMAAVLAAHNDYRARHCAPPLAWSPELAEVAAGWADTLKFNGCAFEHSTSPYGENLAFFMPKSTGERATRGWYDEVSLYKFSRPGFDMRTGHFTQVVWRATERLGCAAVECKGGQIWVCNYDPPGNVEGQYRANVAPTTCR